MSAAKVPMKHTIWTAPAGTCAVLEALDTNAPLGDPPTKEFLAEKKARLAQKLRVFRRIRKKGQSD